MEYKHRQQATRSWTTRRDEMKRRMQLVSSWMSGPLLPRERLVESLEASLRRRLPAHSCERTSQEPSVVRYRRIPAP
jgi:hypothetical protein